MGGCWKSLLSALCSVWQARGWKIAQMDTGQQSFDTCSHAPGDGQCLPDPLCLVAPRGSSAVCVYSFGDIDDVFRTSKLKGYNGPNPEIKPGQVSGG